MKKILVAFSALCLSALSLEVFAYGQDWDSMYSGRSQDYYSDYQPKKHTANRSHRSHYTHGRYHHDGYRQTKTSHKKRNESHAKRHRRSSESESSASQPVEKAPLPQTISSGQKTIKIDLSKRVFGAYDSDGHLVKWGRVSGGKNYCADIGKSCRTPTGTFTIYSKKGGECTSSRFPLPNGGARMPYCMHFHGGYAMHGGHVPNYNASHGCVRMHASDAKWLNQKFVQVGSTKVNITR